MTNDLIDIGASTTSTNFIVPKYIPDRDLGELFIAVQQAKVFADTKTFVDCSPNKDPALILVEYENIKNDDTFSIEAFVLAHFTLPPVIERRELDANKDMFTHVINLWDYLTVSSTSSREYTSLINLPYPFVVPGGRFGEMFYWDSYFTIIGLLESGKDELVMGIIRNMAYMVATFGHIPNGNRTYFLSRSQPPFFAEIIKCYGQKHGMDSILEFLPTLEMEYVYWTKDNINVNEQTKTAGKSVWLEDGIILNRYTGTLNTPRAEAYDKELGWAQSLPKETRPKFHQNLRAACESGWDFSSRWFADGKNKSTVQCEDFIPICLNTLLYNCEEQLANMYRHKKGFVEQEIYEKLAFKRKTAISKYCWLAKNSIYNDYNFITQSPNNVMSIAMVYPLFFGLATQEQADIIAETITEHFLVEGGILTTLVTSGEQWDAPNGWAPMQWLTVIGLEKYGHIDLAKTIATRWLKTNKHVFETTGKMTEKYNVVDVSFPGGGGNYENQDGFGWTNGVALALQAWLRCYNVSFETGAI